MLGLALSLGWSPKLGLDLEGGLSVTYQPVETGHRVSNATLQTVVTIMTNRVDALGVSQPNISSQGGDVVLQLPGVKDAATILKQVGVTAQLYFRPVLCGAPAFSAPTAKKDGKTVTKSVAYTTPPTCAAPYRYSVADYDTTTSNFEPPQQDAEDPAYSVYPSTPVGKDDPTKNVILSVGSGGGIAPRYVLGPSEINKKIVTGTIIKSAYAQLLQTGGWVVVFNLTGSGSPIFNDIAQANYHQLVANDLDGTIVSAPVIDAQNFNGSGQISGSFTENQVNALSVDLNYGSLPVRLEQLTVETVSPSLGKSSLRAGLLAGLLGLLLVMGYTIFYYRALGIVVVLGLVTTAAFLYGFISMLGASSLGLRLDLSGVTGLIVSVGITVDSYIVYFERLKDEVRAGRSIRTAVDRGFRSAYRTILSADAVSFIGAIVLWQLSTGDVRGFAFMLGLSTILDVITAYVFTRPFVILIGQNRNLTEARHIGVARGLATARTTP
jgi:preprotein translocase subunit SecD